jgi:hypothetical protein
LNTIRSSLELERVEFRDAASDALDTDFCTGSMRGGRVVNANGDGLDVSGSTLTIDGTRFENVGDKAISVGEASRVRATRIDVDTCGTGVASKDGSVTEVAGGRVANARIAALMTYIKKSEYGPATLRATDVQIERAGRDAIAQTGSRLSIDDVELATERVDVEALYRSGPMRK